MSDSKQPFDDNQEFEIALRSIAPAAPARSAADIAFEAGRREAISQQRQTLWIHRAATAAAILVAGMVGVQALVQPAGSTPIVAEKTPASPNAPQRDAAPPRMAIAQRDRTLDALTREARSVSYLSWRNALLDGQWREIEPTTPTAGSSGYTPARAPSIADFLREQRGL